MLEFTAPTLDDVAFYNATPTAVYNTEEDGQLSYWADDAELTYVIKGSGHDYYTTKNPEHFPEIAKVLPKAQWLPEFFKQGKGYATSPHPQLSALSKQADERRKM